MKRSYKITALVMAVLLMLSLLAGCASGKDETPAKSESTIEVTPLVDALNKGDYATAYKEAKTDGEKNLVRCENAVAYICDYFDSALKYAEYEGYQIKVIDAYAKGHQNDGVNAAKYAVKLECAVDNEILNYYYYFAFNVDEKEFEEKILADTEYIEGFADMTMDEQLVDGGEYYSAGFSIDRMKDESGLYGYKMPEDTVKRINQLIKDGKLDGVDIDIDAQCQELPWKTKFE